MPNRLNHKHSLANVSIGGGFLTDGNKVAIGANSGGLGIFDYLGKNRGTAARSNPVSQSSAFIESTTPALTHIGNVRAIADPTGSVAILAWTDGVLVNGAFAGGTLGSGNAITYDFCKGINTSSIVNGQTVNNQCLVKLNAIMMYWSGAPVGVTQGFSVFGSRDGYNYDELGVIIDGPRTWATGWLQYNLTQKKYYRFIRIVGGSAGLKFFDGSSGFHELDLFGTIKFLKTSKS